MVGCKLCCDAEGKSQGCVCVLRGLGEDIGTQRWYVYMYWTKTWHMGIGETKIYKRQTQMLMKRKTRRGQMMKELMTGMSWEEEGKNMRKERELF